MRVHDSQAYRKMDVTRERISRVSGISLSSIPAQLLLRLPKSALLFASLYSGQEVFVWSNCLLDLGMDILVGSMVFVGDA